MILFRYLLIVIIGFLIVRAITSYGKEKEPPVSNKGPGNKEKDSGKKVSKKVGEYIDYEELGKKKK